MPPPPCPDAKYWLGIQGDGNGAPLASRWLPEIGTPARMRSSPSPVMNWLLKHAPRRQLPPQLGFVAATLLVVAIALLRDWLLSDTAPWFVFVPVVLALALLFGRAVGIYATLLSALLVGYAIGSTGDRYWLSGTEWVATGLFVISTLGVVLLAAELRDAFRLLDTLMGQREADFRQMGERESFLSSVLASSPDCIKVLTLDGQLTFMTAGGM